MQKFIKSKKLGLYGYEEDIEILEQSGQLTEDLARKIFTKLMDDAYRTRTILKPKENDEFEDLIKEVYSKYDSIPKPQEFEEYGFYDRAYNDMELDEIYSNMQIAFEVTEMDAMYYGCRDLRNIAKSAINSIDGIEKYKIELQQGEKEELQLIQEELKNLLSEKTTNIQAIRDRVERYNEHATTIWNDYLTDIDNEEESPYRWVVHNLTKGELKGNFRNKYMSTSLMTNNEMGRFGSAEYGLIIEPKHIVSASYKDTYTFNTRDDEENLFNIRPPIMLPQEVEDMCIKQTIEENGEMLNYDKTPIYSEVVVDEYEIKGVYYVSYGEHELAKDYERAKKVAEERGLPLVERDISKYRAEHGLEPMTEKAKKNFCRNILWKCCVGDIELEQTYSKFSDSFIDNNFGEFYKDFIRLKENPEVSEEDILKAFSDVARGDIDFDKISKNIDEKYGRTEGEQKVVEEIQEKNLLKQKYGIGEINDGASLKRRLEEIISNGILLGADQNNEKAMAEYNKMKQVIPKFEEFKRVYIQLREKCIEDRLYNNLDFKNVSYDNLLERATFILEERAKEKSKENATLKTVIEEKQFQVEKATNVEDVAYESKPKEESRETPKRNEMNAELDNDSMRKAHIEYLINCLAQQTSKNAEDYWNENHLQQPKKYWKKQPKEYEQQQPEKTRPKEEAIRDEVGDELNKTEIQMQKQESPLVDLWINRFNGWYGAIDRVSQNVKEKFVKMKSDIINAISEKLEDINNNRQMNTQNQDTNER